MKKRSLFVAGSLLACVYPSLADSFQGELYYTRFSGAPNVRKVAVSFDDNTDLFSVGAPTDIGTTSGADGITGDPKNSDLLFVGGQGGHINTISKTTGATVSYSSPASVFHLAVPTTDTLLGSGIPGALARHTILPGGGLSAGTLIGISGPDNTVTTVISTPSGYFYTDAGSGGFGSFGTIAFNSGIDTATSGVTTRIADSVPSAHGGVYDPYTGDIFLFGDGQISQWDLSGTPVGSRAFSGANFDQGAVDGNGHLFVASNNGQLLMVDYTDTGDVTSPANPTYFRFLDSNLDDIAPLVGPGGTSNVPEAGATMLMFGLGVAGLELVRRMRK